MRTKTYRVVPAGPCWEAEVAGTKRKVVLRGPLKRDLVMRTIEMAKKEKRSEVIIFKEDGSIEEKKFFRLDPDKITLLKQYNLL